MKIADVFTAGGVPNITYNSRESNHLEANLLMDLDIKGKIISVTGPTKIGKTTLCKKVITDDRLILISGGGLKVLDDFWSTILTKMAVANSWNKEEGNEDELKDSKTTRVFAEGGFLGWLKAGVDLAETKQKGNKKHVIESKSYTPSPMNLAVESLLAENKVLLIDDFHYCDKDLQRDIIRALKEPIAQGLSVIVSSVPHRGVDSVKVEQEMEGRVIQFPIEPWKPEELHEISKKGFEALNLDCPKSIIDDFINESYKSPHLMQDFCYWYCRNNGIFEKQVDKLPLPNELDLNNFFGKLVKDNSSRDLYERLVTGPEGGRKLREFKNGSEGDIYYAIMIALSNLTHQTEITVDMVREQLKEILTSNSMPNKTQITNVLKKMSELARDYTNREPAIDFQSDRLYVVDPFFSFYLKWSEK